MKKSLLALATLTAFGGVASAQSTVTVFGVLDLNLQNQKNGSAGSIKSVSTNGLNSSRLGFRGVEDLGGGLSAGFWIEGALSPNNGNAAGLTFQRRSTVSLSGGFGELRLGRDFTASYNNHGNFDVFGNNGVGSALSIVSVLGSGAGTLVRANNTVSYFLPKLDGMYGQLQVAAGQGVAPPAGAWNKYAGAQGGYRAGPFDVSAAYGVTYRDSLPDDLKAFNVGGSYNLGFMTLMSVYSKYSLGAADQTNIVVGATVPVGVGVIRASYAKASGTGTTFDADLIALGYVHHLSKRTALYGTYGRINNGGGATGARFVTTANGPAFTTGGQTSTGYELGLRHAF